MSAEETTTIILKGKRPSTCFDKKCKDFIFHRHYCNCECPYGRKMSEEKFSKLNKEDI